MRKFFMFFLVAMFIVAMGYSQSITVTNPHGGENWVIGNTYTITWNSSGISGTVGIKLFQNGSSLGYIDMNVPNSGTYTWTINSIIGVGPITPGTHYQIQVKKSGVAAGLSGEFTISNPPSSASITVTNPHGGEVWCKGHTYTITWNSSGITGPVGIKLFQNGSSLGYVAQNVSNTGHYSWTIGNIIGVGPISAGSHYQIQVKKSGVAAGLSGEFRIKSSCSGSSGPSFDPDRFTAALDLVELAILMHGPWPVIDGIGSMREVLEKQGVKVPIRVRLMKGREVVQDFGVFTPVLKRGRVFFNSMPTTFSLKLTPKMKEMLGAHPEEFRLVIMSKGGVLAEKPLKLQERRGGVLDSQLTTINPKIIKNIRVIGCPDPAVVDIKFSIVQRYSQFRGKVRITGVVKNVGKADYISKPGRQSIVLDAGDAAHPLKTIPFTNLKSGQSITISYELNWDSASPNEGEFPPTYRVYIVYDPDITMDSIKTNDDCNMGNNSMSKSGRAINDMLK